LGCDALISISYLGSWYAWCFAAAVLQRRIKVDTKERATSFLPSEKKRGYRVCSSGYAATDTS
jgi:hypothetical protein